MTELSIAFQSNKPLAEYGELGELVEACGFDGVSIYNDLYFQPAWMPLLLVAQHTRAIRLGPAAVNPFTCHPVNIAGNAALLDEASSGRAYLGLARGAWLEPLGLGSRQPITAMREAIEIVRRLWQGDPGPFHGQVFQLPEDAALRWRLTRRQMPILLGTWGERMVEATADLIDQVKLGGSANPALVRWMRKRLDAVSKGRAIGLAIGAVTVVDENPRVAEEWVRRELVLYLPVVARLDPTYHPDEQEIRQVEVAMQEGDTERAARAIAPDTLRRFAFFGTPADIERQIGELFDAGADRVELGTPHGVNEGEVLRLLARQVLPALRR